MMFTVISKYMGFEFVDQYESDGFVALFEQWRVDMESRVGTDSLEAFDYSLPENKPALLADRLNVWDVTILTDKDVVVALIVATSGHEVDL